MSVLYIDNAITWAQFRLKGGVKGALTTSLIYTVILGGAVFLTLRLDDRPTHVAMLLRGWTTMLLVAQAGILVLLGASRVNAAVKRDLTTGVIESHRLMPLPAGQAIAGYVLGPCTQALALAVATFLVGAITAAAAGVTLDRWATANAVLLSFAVFLWVLAAMTAFLGRATFALGFLLSMIGGFTGGIVLMAVPGLAVLVSPLSGDTVFGLSATHADFPAGYAISLVAQVVIAAICFAAAARKYRRADALALVPVAALALLAAWVGVSAAGLRYWDLFRPAFFGRGGPPSAEPWVQAVISTLVSLIVATVPLASTAWSWIGWNHHRALRDPAPMRRPAPAVLVILTATALVCLLPRAVPPERELRVTVSGVMLHSAVQIAIVVFSFLVGVYSLMRTMYGRTGKANLLISLWVAVLFFAPLLVDAIHQHMVDPFADFSMGEASAASPIGLLAEVWGARPIDTRPGLAAQVVITLFALALCLTLRRRPTSAASGFDVMPRGIPPLQPSNGNGAATPAAAETSSS